MIFIVAILMTAHILFLKEKLSHKSRMSMFFFPSATKISNLYNENCVSNFVVKVFLC